MTDDELKIFGSKLLTYCTKFNVPLTNIFEILEDQKVTPMIRGKAMEHNAVIILKSILPSESWIVDKLNLNAQPNHHDQDISITHKRTGTSITVECKSAVRGSIKVAKVLKDPYFQVKCHRSRSHLKKASNDKYADDSFDILITTTENAIYQGNTIGELLEIIHKKPLRDALFSHYGVILEEALIKASREDWRYCSPKDISIDGFIPRTPKVKLIEDTNWRPLIGIQEKLLEIVEIKRKSSKSK
jgi:hypothetical protein